MSTSAADALQKALFQCLRGSLELKKCLGGEGDRIFDLAPHPVPYPYLVLSSHETRTWNTSTEQGEEHFLIFEIFSRERGRHSLNILLDVCMKTILSSSFTLEEHLVISIEKRSCVTIASEKDHFLKGNLSFRVLTENKI